MNRTEAPIFFRFGFYNYVKVNAERGQKQFLEVRPSVDTWNRYDFLLDWEDGMTKLYVDGNYKHSFVFFEAVDRFWFTEDKDPIYNGVDSIVLYNLSPGVTSSFAEVQLCAELCDGIILNKGVWRHSLSVVAITALTAFVSLT